MMYSVDDPHVRKIEIMQDSMDESCTVDVHTVSGNIVSVVFTLRPVIKSVVHHKRQPDGNLVCVEAKPVVSLPHG